MPKHDKDLDPDKQLYIQETNQILKEMPKALQEIRRWRKENPELFEDKEPVAAGES